MVRVHTGLGFGLEHGLERAEALADVLHVHRTTGVGHIHAGGAVALHQLRLLRQLLAGQHVAHHQEADGVHAQLASVFDVLTRDVRLGAVSSHTYHSSTCVVRILEVMHRADARQQQGSDLGMANHIGHRFDVLEVRMLAEAVVEAGALQAVTVCDLDGVHLRLVQRSGDVLGVLQRVLMSDGVAAVAQGHVGDVELLIRVHRQASTRRVAAMRSAQAMAAEVMMSRLPA
ncbi:hypothetical protein D9M68_457430 [compost metagenome]